MINIQTADRATLECEILFNDELYNHIEKLEGSTEDFILNSSDEILRETLTNWVIENNEATC